MNPLYIVATVLIVGSMMLAPSLVMAQSQNDTAQYIQLKKFAALIGRGATGPLMTMMMPSNDVDGYKQLLSTLVAVHEGYTNDPNPANYAASNQTLANLDAQITIYLCNIDQTYCANGPNAPTRILVNGGG